MPTLVRGLLLPKLEHWQVLNFDFDADPYPAFYSNADPYSDLAAQK
jgi:hypothetical protein